MRTLTVLIAALALGFAPAPRHNSSRADFQRLEGRWVMTAREPYPIHMGCTAPRVRLVIAGHRVKVVCGNESCEFVLSLDAGTSPKRYALKCEDELFRGQVVLGIYTLEGDTLKLCHNNSSHRRPEAFEGAHRGEHIEVYKRER
jgi:uncharacterized protein (TIGR03067 family)